MHRILRREVFDPPSSPVAAELVDPVGPVAAHGHDFLELAVVVRGTATHVSADGVRALRAGSVLVVRPGDWHGYRDCERLAVHNVYIGLELFDHQLAWIRTDPAVGPVLWPRATGVAAGQLRPTALRRMGDWLTALAAGPDGAPPGSAWRLGHLLLVVNEIAGAVGPLPAGTPTHPAVLRATQLLESDLTRAWTLAELGAAVNLAPTYLARRFRYQVGLAPLAYLARRRAERAAGLLIESDLTVAAIGARVGWADPNYLARRFTARYGLSPTGYRARYRHGDARGDSGADPT